MFLGTYFFVMGLIMLLAVVFDVSENIDMFLDKGAPLKEIIYDHYFNFVLYYSNLFSFLIVFISVLWFTSRMAQRTEIVAILAGGVSFPRLLRPYMISATLLVIIALFMNYIILPHANQKRLAFEERYMRDQNAFEINRTVHFHRKLNDSTYMYFKRYNTQNDVAHYLGLETWKNNVLTQDITCASAEWDPETGSWKMKNYYNRNFSEREHEIIHGQSLDTIINFIPEEVKSRINISETMSIKELKQFIQEEEVKGSNRVVFYNLDYHQRTAYPFASYILVIMGLSVAGKKTRGGTGINIALGIFLAFLYIFAMKFAQVASTNAGLAPIIAVWIPNFIFGLAAIYTYKKAQK